MKKIQRFFIKSSGANCTILENCPTHEVNRYTAIGVNNLITSSLAAISTYVILFSIFNNFILALFLGIILGLFVFTMEALLINSTKKYDNRKAELASLIPRLILAIILAFIIAKPLEIALFKDLIMSNAPDNNLPSFFAALMILDEETNSNQTVFNSRLFINGLMIALNIMPLLIKMFTPKGVYDFLVEEFEERRKFDAAVSKIRSNFQASDPGLPNLEEFQKTFAEAKKQIGKNETRQAIEKLISIPQISHQYYNELITLSARIEMVDRDKRIGQISSEKHLISINQINMSLLELIDRLNH